MSKPRIDTRTVATLAMLAALAYAVMLVSKLIPSVNGFLDFDFKDTVICIAGFTFGPAAALILAVLVPVLEMLTVSTTGPVGLLMNVLATASFCCTACAVYKRRRTRRGAVLGLGLAVLVLTAVMLLWNYIVTPLYQHVPRDVVAGMLIPVFLPFNLVKGGLNMGTTLLLYKPVVTALRSARLAPPSQSAAPRRGGAGYVLFSLAVLATFVLLALALLKVI